jgi:tetratricopeptide (TPR) repeat protein
LALNYNSTSQPELAAHYAEQAYRLEDRGVAEETLDRTCWYHTFVTGNQHKALEALTMQRQASPDGPWVPSNLAMVHNRIGQSEAALAEAPATLRVSPNFSPVYRNISLALLRLNRFAEAKDTLQQAQQRKLDETEFHLRLYQLAFIAGDAAEMQRQVEAMRGNPEESAAFDWQTGAAAFAGRWRQAQELSRRAIDLAAQYELKEVAARYATEQALRSAVLGNCQTSKASAAQGLAFGRGRLPLARAALALALCGAGQQAKPLADELSKRFPEDTMSQEVWLPTIRAALALQQSKAAQALEQLRNTSRYEAAAEFWPPYLRGQAYLQLKQNTEAAAEFQKILDHRGYAPLSVLYPLAQLGLARATRSQKNYDAFLAVWKEADADLPLLLTARKEAP